ncbi:MAG TPA: DNA polymerase ligase N-terminal domain-containing protein [Rhizomicrobium sp.]|jgi:bifunctional non-homologous end joining protein LigD|nr:DNA polymerase ligase N-terminal domain-containing protein [Rhizomicrobium sp.]
MSRLSAYNAKRDFKKTAEPHGKLSRGSGRARRFVIQRHAATRLHYDLRLELDGVYKSWAVTKTPSYDPAVKRLAVEVEDHPIDYGTFEGTIPEGEYGGGTVQLWDRGTWAPQGDGAPGADLEHGHLKIELDGERMKGGWALIRLRDRDERPGRKVRHNWLLIKEKDSDADPRHADKLEKAVTSVKTGRSLDQIAKGSRAVWHSNKSAAENVKALRKRAAPSKKPAKKTRTKTKKKTRAKTKKKR